MIDSSFFGSTGEEPGPSFPHNVHRSTFLLHPGVPGNPNGSAFPVSAHDEVFGPTRIDDSLGGSSSFSHVFDPYPVGSSSGSQYPGQIPPLDVGYPHGGEFGPSLDYHLGRAFGPPYPENNSGRGIISTDVDSFGDGFADSPLEGSNHSPRPHDDGSSKQGIFLQVPVDPVYNETIMAYCGNLSRDYRDVLCVPEPDAFNPCEDIMGNIGLRVAVWFVVVTAVLGNLAVMLVLLSSKFRLTVSKFLMVNLAFADLCMGVYLLLIAAMDLHTIGVYFNYAIDWQNGAGCKVAGFLTVFASELSIFTLTVITSERWYAITYAIHLNKRLKLSMAAKIMVLGWAYSLTMASLPLLGVSGYSKTSICLPMETADGISLAYLIILLLVNGLAFVVITACYASMYISISRHEVAATHSDLTVAKRMALLVFTDFACWAPIAFFGLTAVAGLPLIDVTRAKILLVFFYPLNSCANPYLYAILTKQYRHDLFILLARYGICTQRAMRYKGAISSANHTNQHQMIVHSGNHHRLSTLTQITLCELPRRGQRLSHHSTRSFHSAISHQSTGSHQSGTGNTQALTTSLGSQDSLQRSPNSPSRVSSRGEQAAEGERLSTVQEMSHSNVSDEEDLQSSPPPYHGQKDHMEESEMLLSKPYMPLLHNEPSVIISEPQLKGLSGRLLKYDSDSSTSSPELVVTFSKSNYHNHKGASAPQVTVPAKGEPASNGPSSGCPAQDHQSLPSLGGDGLLHTSPTTTSTLPVIANAQNTFGLPLRPRSANLEGNYIRTESFCPQPEKRAHSWTLIPRNCENHLLAGEGLVRIRDPPSSFANNMKFPPENVTKRNPSPSNIASDGTASPSESLVRSPAEFPYQTLECQLDSPPCKSTMHVTETTSTNSLLFSSSSSSISKAQDLSSSSNGYRFIQ